MTRAANRGMGAALAAIALATLTPAAQASPATLPAIFPAPAAMTLGDGTVTLGRAVTLIVAPGTEPETAALVRDLLAKAGVTDIATAQRLPASPDRPTIVIGPDSAAPVREALSRAATPARRRPRRLYADRPRRRSQRPHHAGRA